MRTHLRIALATAAAACLLATAAGTAAAEMGIQIGPNSTVANRGSISIRYRDAMRTATITCNLALGLRYVRGVEKADAGRLAEGQIGNIVSAMTGGCRQMMTNWTVIILVNEMNPIPMVYQAFLGTLPEITGLLITALDVGVRIVSMMANCLYDGDLPFLVSEVGGGQSFDQKTFLANTLDWQEGMACPMEGTLEISGTLEVDPPMNVRLV